MDTDLEKLMKRFVKDSDIYRGHMIFDLQVSEGRAFCVACQMVSGCSDPDVYWCYSFEKVDGEWVGRIDASNFVDTELKWVPYDIKRKGAIVIFAQDHFQ